MPDNLPQGDTQTARRTRYGINVAVAVLAAVLLVILLNWTVHHAAQRATGGVRFDLTSTRQYSLSPQTRQVLKDLTGEYQIVTLFTTTNDPLLDMALGRGSELIDEYSRYGRNIKVEHIDPSQELTRLEVFYGTLRDRYKDQLKPIEDSVKQGQAALAKVRQGAAPQLAKLKELLADPGLPEGDFRADMRSVLGTFARIDPDLDTATQRITKALAAPLPDLANAFSAVQKTLDTLDEGLYAKLVDRLGPVARAADTPASVKEKLLALEEMFKATRTDIQAATKAMRSTKMVEDYDKLRDQLDTPDAVVVIGPKEVRVLGVRDLVREPDPNQADAGTPDYRFQGEERITGALMAMTMTHKPLVVFVFSGRSSPLMPASQDDLSYLSVAERLRNANFQVEQWSPMPQGGQMGMRPPGPPPEPEPGQKAVWVVLPAEPMNPMNPMMGGGGEQQVAEIVRKRLEAGDSALFMLQAPPFKFGGPSAIAQMIEPFGITAQLDRVVMRQVTLPNGRILATPELQVAQWPTALSVSQAIGAMPGFFAKASPLVLSPADKDKKFQTWPVAEIRGRDMWAALDYDQKTEAKPDPRTAGDTFVVGAAAQGEKNRVVVVADPYWATDQVLSIGALDMRRGAVGVMFPANGELFVNSVYWLAGLEHSIAASARSQDVRRIGDMSSTGLLAWRWGLLAGMPFLVLAAGMGVWLVRRQG